jgi:CDP-glucose 4,6-dehydratase
VAAGKGAVEGLGMSEDFWQGKTVLITGHTGFKGSWLSLWLQKKGANVVGYSLAPPSNPSLFQLADVGRLMVSLHGDIKDLAFLKRVFEDHKPQIVIHMAAQSLVRCSYQDPVETFHTNVMGTVNLLEAVRHCETVHVALIITSDKCYENKEWFWGYRENDRLGGHDPYSCSKGCSELISSAYRRSFLTSKNGSGKNVAMATARAGNVIGGGDWAADRLIPDIIRATMENRAVVLRYPAAIRPWQHVLEPLNGYLMLVEKLWQEEDQRFSGAWNFGPNENDARPVSCLVNHFTKQLGGGASWSSDSAEQPHEATYLKLDCSKAKALLGWAPRLDLDKAIEWTAEWYRVYLQKRPIFKVTEKQISLFENLKDS